MATYVISDIHGCFDEFQRILKEINFSEYDRLYLAGDYIDRGEQSYEMLRWLEDCPENVLPIKGNHDAEFSEYVSLMLQIDRAEELDTDPDSNEDSQILYDTTRYTLRRKNREFLGFFDYYGTIGDLLRNKGVTFAELICWARMFEKYPYYYRFFIGDRDCIIVHAGYCEDSGSLSEKYGSIEEFYLYAREEAVQIGGVKDGLIIAGHTPTIAKDTMFYTDGEVFRKYDEDKNCIFYDIDCGCAYYKQAPGGTLSCLRLEDEEVFYL